MFTSLKSKGLGKTFKLFIQRPHIKALQHDHRRFM